MIKQCVSAREQLDRLEEKATQRYIPLSAFIELTYTCNLHCVHCCVVKDPARKELSTQEICSLFDQLADAGCLWIALSGGEILNRDDFFTIASYARKKQFALHLLTNATLISEQNIAALAELAPLAVDISLYGATAATHDAVTGTPGSFTNIMRSVELLKKHNIRVIAKTLLMTLNIHELKAMFQLTKSLGITHLFDVQMLPKNNRDQAPLRYQLDDKQLLDFALGDIPEREKYAPELSCEDALKKPLCGPAVKTVAISPYGDVYPCAILLMPMGNIRKKPLIDIFHHPPDSFKKLRALQTHEQLPACRSCTVIAHCTRCHGTSYLYTDDYTSCTPATFTLAKIQKTVNTIRQQELLHNSGN